MKYIRPKPFSPEYVDAHGAMLITTEDEARLLFEHFAKGDIAAAEAVIGAEVLRELKSRAFQILTPHERSNIDAELLGCPVIVDRRRGERRRGDRRRDP